MKEAKVINSFAKCKSVDELQAIQLIDHNERLIDHEIRIKQLEQPQAINDLRTIAKPPKTNKPKVKKKRYGYYTTNIIRQHDTKIKNLIKENKKIWQAIKKLQRKKK